MMPKQEKHLAHYGVMGMSWGKHGAEKSGSKSGGNLQKNVANAGNATSVKSRANKIAKGQKITSADVKGARADMAYLKATKGRRSREYRTSQDRHIQYRVRGRDIALSALFGPASLALTTSSLRISRAVAKKKVDKAVQKYEAADRAQAAAKK